MPLQKYAQPDFDVDESIVNNFVLIFIAPLLCPLLKCPYIKGHNKRATLQRNRPFNTKIPLLIFPYKLH